MLQKQPVNISFAQGLDTKSDPWQIPIGKFSVLNNYAFQKTGLLQKRNGFGQLTSLPNASSSYLTTFNGNLTAIGNSLEAYNTGSDQWFNKGLIQPLRLSVLPVVRNTFNQIQCDSALASNGLICTVYSEQDIGATHYYYAIDDSTTGQNIVPATLLVTPQESPRVFILGNYFIILYSQSANLNYISIPVAAPTIPNAPVTLVVNYAVGATQLAYDGVIANNNLYIAYNASDGGGAIRATYLNSFLVRQTTNTGSVITAGKSASFLAVTADTTGFNVTGYALVIWILFYKISGTSGWLAAADNNLNVILGGTTNFTASDILSNVSIVAQNGIATAFGEEAIAYGYDSSIPTHFVYYRTCNIFGATSAVSFVDRSIGLASKAFILSGTIYLLGAYSSPYQPTYFLINVNGNVISKLAYQNGGGYLIYGLPSVNIYGSQISIAYLYKDLIAAVNKDTNVPSGTQIDGIYSQTGINFATFNITTAQLSTAEIGQNLNLTGGFLWGYDGYQPTEQNFFLYPDSVECVWSATGGAMAAQPNGLTNMNAYYYQATYEWTDQEGNAFRSAPSIPFPVTTTGSGSSGSVTINVPTLRLTYKTNVKICVYRWSVAQQEYYQVTSISQPYLNNKTVDSIAIPDTFADATILGNSLLYTTGGVVEDIGPPAFNAVALFKSRLMGIDAEDPNTIWYSKQVISGTPVEMSDLFTLYLAPTTGAQGSTGPTACLFPMDDKLILFKKNAGIYYLTGDGPDNTGANSDYGDFVFVTSTIGCNNQASIVFVPPGLMFQDGTGKGIWLLGRDLSTSYIGAPVEQYNSQIITSAFAIPGTNQVRFTLESGVMVVYDYYFEQWSTFSSSNLTAISSCLYEELHTYIDQYGRVFQETPGEYLDGSNPVLLNFTTGWINLAGLQGQERAYWIFLLGQYLSPHKLSVSIAYDYNPSPTQTSVIAPINFSPAWGETPFYGDSQTWGGPSNVEQWRIFLAQQQCESFQVSVSESFDASFGTIPGAGLTLSGMNLIVGMKKGYRRIGAQTSVG